MEIEDKQYQSLENTVRTASTSVDRIEITQQQLSRTFAFLLVALFLIFLSGYTLGKYRMVHHTNGQFAPSLYNIVYGKNEMLVPIMHVDQRNLGSEYGLFATFEEADKLCRNLRKNRIPSQVVMRNSSTVSGTQIAHYVVCREALSEKGTGDTDLHEQSREDLKKGVEIHD